MQLRQWLNVSLVLGLGWLLGISALASAQTSAQNSPPVAFGSSVIAVKNTARDITLSAIDADSDPLTFIPASKSSKGGTVVLKSGNVVTYTPKVGYVGVDSFTFRVKDSKKAVSNTATVQITRVKAKNTAPVANAGTDQTVNKQDVVMLDGSTSTDTDGNIVSYVWKQTAGKVVVLSKSGTAKPSFVAPDVANNTKLTFELTVKDNNGAVAKDSLVITVTPNVTLSGATSGLLVVGGTVTVKDYAGKLLGTTKTGSDGKFRLSLSETSLKNGYVLSLRKGKLGTTAFTGELTATYAAKDVKVAANLTAVTTLVDKLAVNAVGATKLAKRNAAIRQLAKIGMVKEDNWSLLVSDYFDLSALALRIKDAGGINVWTRVIEADLIDGELSVEEMRSLFPKAHGGIESVSVYANVSVFPGGKAESAISIDSPGVSVKPVIKLFNAPSWMKIEDRGIIISTPSSQPPGIHVVDIDVSPDGIIASRRTQFTISVLKQVTLLTGMLDAAGGKIESAWRDIVISAPAGALTKNYEITYLAGINSNDEVVLSFQFSPEISNAEREKLNISQPKIDVLRTNYLSDVNIVQTQAKSQSAMVTTKGGEVFIKPGLASDACWNEWKTHGWDDGEKGNYADPFTSVLQTADGVFSYQLGLSGFIALARARILPQYAAGNVITGGESKCASILVSYNSKIQSTKKQPILLIHGYADGKMGEIAHAGKNDPYFFKFPKLLKNSGYPVYGFFWNTNQRFEDAANDLGVAIKKINDRERVQVHIIAHSYGGLLTRTLLQGLARKPEDNAINSEFTHDFMEKRIASVTTVGTPHSGVFGLGKWKDAVSFDNGEPIAFKYGRHGLAGDAIEACAALTCHESGEDWSNLGKTVKFRRCGVKLCPYLVEHYDKKSVFGVEEKPGQVVYRLAKTAYPNVPTQVLIGILPKSQVCNDSDGDGICEMVYDAPADEVGDGLISLAGQRFHPWLHKKGLKKGNIEEHLLGFDASSNLFSRGWQDIYMDVINRSVKWTNGQKFQYRDKNDYYHYSGDSPLSTVRYNHRGGQYDEKNNSVGSSSNKPYSLLRRTPILTEVGLQNCTSPTDCNHATWNYVNTMIALHAAKSLDATQKVKAKGSVGYVAPEAARTAGVAALAANDSVEGFIINIFLDGEQLGTAATDANGAFDLDVEFKPKRTYVLEVYPPASMAAAVAPRAVVVKKTSGLTVEDTDFDFSRIELIKNAPTPQQGELGVQLKDDSTGTVLLGYNLTVANYSNTLVDGKAVSANGDAIMTLPEGLYAVTTTKQGYVGTGKSLCMVRQLASNSCVVMMLPNELDKDGDGLSNLEEYNLGTNPAKADTDGDGFTDKQEVDAGTDPLDKNSFPPLSAPTNVRAIPSDGQITLSWDNVPGMDGYTGCISTHSPASERCDSSFQGGWFDTNDALSVSHTLTGLVNGQKYYISLAWVDNGVEGSSVEVSATPQKANGVTSKLNDTGITTCANETDNNLPCPQADFPGQDAEHGRDANQATNNDADGHRGFSFTKISSTGAELSASATEWSCVKDNVTGLMWEVKTDDGGLHDKDWTYSWYEPDDTKNGGSAGYQNLGSCGGTSQCDTYGFVQTVNTVGWCGYKDWRMPNMHELRGIVSFDHYDPAIDTQYFLHTIAHAYWASSPSMTSNRSERDALAIAFSDGYDFADYKNFGRYVRLVRGYGL